MNIIQLWERNFNESWRFADETMRRIVQDVDEKCRMVSEVKTNTKRIETPPSAADYSPRDD